MDEPVKGESEFAQSKWTESKTVCVGLDWKRLR